MNEASLHILLTLLAFFSFTVADRLLMTGLNKKSLILLHSLFCHLCLQNIIGAHYVSGVFTFSFFTLTITLKVGIFILILYIGKLKIIEFKINCPRTHSSLVKDLRFGHISLSGSPEVFYFILFI